MPIVSKTCPVCGCELYSWQYPTAGMAVWMDRQCTYCKTVYTPPTPRWAYFTFIVLGVALLVVSAYSIYAAFAHGLPVMAGGGAFVLGFAAVAGGIAGLRKKP